MKKAVSAPTMIDTGTRRRNRKCRYASMYRFGSTSPPVAVSHPTVHDQHARPAGAHGGAVGPRRERQTAEPLGSGLLLVAVLPHPGLPTIAAQENRADLAHCNACVAFDRHGIEAGVLVGLPEPDLFQCAHLYGAVLHLPGLPAVGGA